MIGSSDINNLSALGGANLEEARALVQMIFRCDQHTCYAYFNIHVRVASRVLPFQHISVA